MTALYDRQVADHPAKFPEEVTDHAMMVLRGLRDDGFIQRGETLLDPFAGVGRCHLMESIGLETVGVEIEPEWAIAHPRTIVGDATELPLADGSVAVVFTSPTYGSRMGDHHDAKERCKPCGGTGDGEVVEGRTLPCVKCGGRGLRAHKRNTYRHVLNRIDPETGRAGPLHENNSGRMQWGQAYRDLHVKAWAEAYRVLREGGVFLLNISNHIRGGKEVDVVGWHLEALVEAGFTRLGSDPINTRRYGYGQNRNARVDNEWLILLQKDAL